MTNVLRPMSTAELLDQTFYLYRTRFTLFVGIVAVPHLVMLAFQLASLTMPTATKGAPRVIWAIVAGVIYLIALAAAQAATVIAVSRVHLEQPVTIGSALSAIKGRLIQIALIMLAVWIAVGVGLVFLIVPGIILGLMWSLVIPVAVLEDQGLSGATSRSAALTKGNRGRIFIIVFLFIVLVYLVTIVVQLPIFALLTASHPVNPHTVPIWFSVFSDAASFVSNCLVAPLLTIALSLLYYDERVRREGFDLQHMISSLEALSDSPQTAPASI
jgi:hypothetical protein